MHATNDTTTRLTPLLLRDYDVSLSLSDSDNLSLLTSDTESKKKPVATTD